MIAIIDRYINMVRISKFKTGIFSLCFAVVCFTTSYMYRDTSNGLSDGDSMIVSLVSSTVLGIVWFVSSLVMVKISDGIEERKAKARVSELEERRKKAEDKLHKKVNNKKRKKNRNKTVSK